MLDTRHSYSNEYEIINYNTSKKVNQQFYYFYLRNTVSVFKELRGQLQEKFSDQLAKKLTKKFKKPIEELVDVKGRASGIIKISIGVNTFKMFHYFLRIKGKSQKWIEVFLVNISTEFDLKGSMSKLFKREKLLYRKSLKELLTKEEVVYLKSIGKGVIDFDIEKKLNYSRVELIQLKEVMAKKLSLRNTNELYWVCQRADYVKG